VRPWLSRANGPIDDIFSETNIKQYLELVTRIFKFKRSTKI